MTTDRATIPVRRMPGRYGVARLGPLDPLPAWAEVGPPGFISVTRTEQECSIIAPEDRIPEGVRAEAGFIAFMVEGPLDFALTGILADLTQRLADAGVPVFALSTFDTDWLFVRKDHEDAARIALRAE